MLRATTECLHSW